MPTSAKKTAVYAASDPVPEALPVALSLITMEYDAEKEKLMLINETGGGRGTLMLKLHEPERVLL